VVVVGGGKAAAGMTTGLADALECGGRRATGLVSVPQGCGRHVAGIEVRETRPAAENVPTAAAVNATREMLRLVGSLGGDDFVVALVSGGGSALLAAPREGVPLEEKVGIARLLAARGAPIADINTVRQAASDVKGGGLARACAAGRMIVLVLSDVIGDPLESIASGPCMPVEVDPTKVLGVLDRYGAITAAIAPRLVTVLRADVAAQQHGRLHPAAINPSWTTPRGCRVDHVLLGSNATAVDAAADAARRLGYDVTVRHADPSATATADEVGRRLAREGAALARACDADGRPRAIIEGGEAVVRLPADHGVGGRNQQTVAAALVAMCRDGQPWPAGLVMASVGTDGEDGPTCAAGGFVDSDVSGQITSRGLDVDRAVARCDAMPLLETADGLIVTGPTGTNVADVRILLAAPAGR
jgi:hydroxypyruvate reductase